MPQNFLLFILLLTSTFSLSQKQKPRLVLPIGHTIYPNYACFSNDGKFVATTSLDYTCHIWEVCSGKLIQSLYGHKGGIDFVVFNADNKRILTASRDNTAVLWDLETGLKIYELKDHNWWVSCADFSSDNKYVLTVSEDQIYIWDLKTGEKRKSIRSEFDWFDNAIFSSDNKKIVSASKNKLQVWDIKTGKELKKVDLVGHSSFITNIIFSNDGKTAVSCSNDKTVRTWDVNTGIPQLTFLGNSENKLVALSPSGKKIITYGEDKKLIQWDLISGLRENVFEVNSNVQSINFSYKNNEFIVTKSWEPATIYSLNGVEKEHEIGNELFGVHNAIFDSINDRVINFFRDDSPVTWDLFSGKNNETLFSKKYDFSDYNELIDSFKLTKTYKNLKIEILNNKITKLLENFSGRNFFERIQIDENNWLAYDEHYRFDGTPGAIEKLYFVCGLEVVELNQVKDSLYVPNLVQRIMNGENLDRLPKLSDLNICGVTPVVEPIDKGDGGYRYEITPRTGGVGDIEIYLNGVIRQTESAKRLKLKKGKYSIQVDPKLIARYQIPGEALQVKIIAKTANNSISSRGVVLNHKSDDKPTYRKPSLHAVMIGVDDYKDDKLDLNYAAKDANDLHQALEQASKKFFNVDDTNRVFFYNLTINREGKLGTDKIKGKTPAKVNIIQTLEEIEKKSKPEDILLVFFAGHGEIVDKDQLKLLTVEATSANFEGIRMRELLEQLNKIPAGKRVLILDACHSGAAIKSLEITKLSQKDDKTRDVKDAERQSQRLKELDKLASKSGFAIITASSSDQKALELPQYEHGLMTYALLNAMLNNKSSLDENNQLQLDKWLMATEEEVKKLNQNQSAERMVPVTFTLGKIDDEVRSSIVLKEIPTVYVDNVLNKNTFKDNLNIKSMLSAAFQELSRGSSSQIMVADFPNAVKVNILYEEKGDEVKASIILYKENFEQKFELTGNKANISVFVQDLMNQIRTKIQK